MSDVPEINIDRESGHVTSGESFVPDKGEK